MSNEQKEEPKVDIAGEKDAAKAQENVDDINALDDILEADKERLDITAEERSQANDDDMDDQTKEEYEKFMEEMKSGGGAAEMDFLNKMMGQMFSGMNMGEGGASNAKSQEGAEGGAKMPDFGAFQNQFGDMFKNFEDNPEYDQLANHLLQEFMDKDILEEPLLDSKKKYAEYLEANKDKLTEEELTRYRSQQRCVDEILAIVKNDPNNKDKMIAKFEEMQEFGQPPEPLVNAFGGESPFAAFTQGSSPAGMPGGMPAGMMGGMPGMPGMPNMPPGQDDNCNIF